MQLRQRRDFPWNFLSLSSFVCVTLEKFTLYVHITRRNRTKQLKLLKEKHANIFRRQLVQCQISICSVCAATLNELSGHWKRPGLCVWCVKHKGLPCVFLVQNTSGLCNPLNPELNPICYLLALLAHHFLHVSRIWVKSLTVRLLMSYIYMEHPFLMFLDHTQRRSTVGRTPLDEWSARRRDLYLTTHGCLTF